MNRQQLKSSKYELELFGKAADSKLSFADIDTPGWSSMVKTQSASEVRPRSSWNINHQCQIGFKGKDISNKNLPNHRLRRSEIDPALIRLELENIPPAETYSYGPDRSKYQINTQPLRLSEKIELRLRESKANSENISNIIRTEYSAITNSKLNEKDSSVGMSSSSRVYDSIGQLKPKIIINKQQKLKNYMNSKGVPKSSRFKEITVHQHLYRSSKKLEKKREIYKIMQEKYENQYVTTFNPTIDPHSATLAELKFNGSKIERPPPQLSPNDQIAKPKPDQISQSQNELFEYLSDKKGLVDEQTLNATIESLPLSCLRNLQKIIKKVYLGEQFNEQAFRCAMADKALVPNKAMLIKAFQNFIKKNNLNKKKQLSQSKAVI